jgi:hypothetical protein
LKNITQSLTRSTEFSTKMYGLADNAKREFIAGDVVRLADRGVHRLLNDGDVEIIYISVTSPPFNSGYAYKEKR